MTLKLLRYYQQTTNRINVSVSMSVYTSLKRSVTYIPSCLQTGPVLWNPWTVTTVLKCLISYSHLCATYLLWYHWSQENNNDITVNFKTIKTSFCSLVVIGVHRMLLTVACLSKHVSLHVIITYNYTNWYYTT